MKLILQASVQSNVQVLPRWNFLLLFQDARTAQQQLCCEPERQRIFHLYISESLNLTVADGMNNLRAVLRHQGQTNLPPLQVRTRGSRRCNGECLLHIHRQDTLCLLCRGNRQSRIFALPRRGKHIIQDSPCFRSRTLFLRLQCLYDLFLPNIRLHRGIFHRL